jgi:hypothetical protein
MPNSLYKANYCEENIWQLANRLTNPCQIIFISNEHRHVALWRQKGAPVGKVLVWDYHVVLFEKKDNTTICHDFDSRFAANSSATNYLEATFPSSMVVNEYFKPSFKVISKAEYIRYFSSDRSHMFEGGHWLSLPPEWPCIGRGNNLQQFVDIGDPQFGFVLSLTELLERLRSGQTLDEASKNG